MDKIILIFMVFEFICRTMPAFVVADQKPNPVFCASDLAALKPLAIAAFCAPGAVLKRSTSAALHRAIDQLRPRLFPPPIALTET